MIAALTRSCGCLAGAIGHVVAWLLGKDLKTELDEDLVRLKSLLEYGKIRAASGEAVQRDALGRVLPSEEG